MTIITTYKTSITTKSEKNILTIYENGILAKSIVNSDRALIVDPNFRLVGARQVPVNQEKAKLRFNSIKIHIEKPKLFLDALVFLDQFPPQNFFDFRNTLRALGALYHW
jgi:hypothetical protein